MTREPRARNPMRRTCPPGGAAKASGAETRVRVRRHPRMQRAAYGGPPEMDSRITSQKNGRPQYRGGGETWQPVWTFGYRSCRNTVGNRLRCREREELYCCHIRRGSGEEFLSHMCPLSGEQVQSPKYAGSLRSAAVSGKLVPSRGRSRRLPYPLGVEVWQRRSVPLIAFAAPGGQESIYLRLPSIPDPPRSYLHRCAAVENQSIKSPIIPCF